MKTRVIIIGAAGQARENAWYIEAMNAHGADIELLGFVVSDISQLSERDSSNRILGDYGWLRAHHDRFDGFVLGIGNPAARLRIAADLSEEFPAYSWPTIIHPNASLDWSTAKVGRGVTIGNQVVGTVNITVGDWAMLNFGATIGHEAQIGRGCVVNPGANVSGGVTLGESALVGAGAVIRQYVRIGARATVGAGAVVIRDVPNDVLVTGVPARPRPVEPT